MIAGTSMSLVGECSHCFCV